MKKKIVCLILCLTMCIGMAFSLSGCGKDAPDAFVIMTEELDGLFNPFFSTTAADGTIVSMTQIGMLTTGYEVDASGKKQVTVAFGDDHAVVTKDYASEYNSASDTTTYTFVIKNGILYSDGQPLTIEDVIFNMYVYLDPVYTGSSTMYSTDIKGLADYRSQTNGADSDVDDAISEQATARAKDRINELITLFYATGATATAGSYDASYEKMVEAIMAHSVSSGYIDAVTTEKLPNSELVKMLLADYDKALEYFKEELETDYVSAQEAFSTDDAPYKDHKEYFENEVFCFLYYENFIKPVYEKVDGKDNKNKIESFEMINILNNIKTKDAAIKYVYDSTVNNKLDQILKYWATAQKLTTEYTAKAKEVILRENTAADGTLNVPNISGIVSLGHTTDETTIKVNGTDYAIAHEHNEDGTPKNANEYDVLQITINGVDPKAVWNFAFAVAPQHYYANGYTVNIKENKFGVDFGSYEFMTNVIQKPEVTKVPLGAGAYKATNNSNGDNPTGTEFFKDNVVYFKANESFLLGTPKINKIRYQVVSASNALNALASGTVHYATPQLTDKNIQELDKLKGDGIESTYTDQLGYGYIGINAGKVKDINLRKAIMAAMDTSLALSYYRTNTAEKIYWPMSTVSWAYPTENGQPSKDNGHEYIAIDYNRETAKQQILDYMEAANVSAGDKDLQIKFTIAGSNLTDHPTYNTFQSAADLLNECGWDIEVVADTQALTKLSTGSLAVWAAAWGSTVDPDLYQVYHKNSTATSVLAWGYREILANPAEYSEENQILTLLSDVIDRARETEDRATRTALYEEAMGYILDLAVEMPVYQRSVLYAYNTEVINPDTLPEDINPYSSPLDRIWEIEFAE